MKIRNLEPTPNPNAFKFNVDVTLTKRPKNFADKANLNDDPIATKLFEVEGVESVFYLQDFITISKTDEAEWEHVMTEVGQRILAFDETSLPQEGSDEEESMSEAASPEEKALLDKVNVIFDEMVRPALADDGGGLDVLGIDGNTLYIRYQGACGTCPSAITGTLGAIQRLLHYHLENDEITIVPA